MIGCEKCRQTSRNCTNSDPFFWVVRNFHRQKNPLINVEILPILNTKLLKAEFFISWLSRS